MRVAFFALAVTRVRYHFERVVQLDVVDGAANILDPSNDMVGILPRLLRAIEYGAGDPPCSKWVLAPAKTS